MAKKVRLQEKADRIKAQFEQAVKDLAQVSKNIEKAEEHLVRVQGQVQSQLKEAEPPKVQDLQGLLKNAGVNLTEDQEVSLSAYLQTMMKRKREDDSMTDLGAGWFGEQPIPDIFPPEGMGDPGAGGRVFGPSRTGRISTRSNPLSRGDPGGNEESL